MGLVSYSDLFVISFQTVFIVPAGTTSKTEENFLVAIFDPKVPQKQSQSIWFQEILGDPEHAPSCCVLTHTIVLPSLFLCDTSIETTCKKIQTLNVNHYKVAKMCCV